MERTPLFEEVLAAACLLGFVSITALIATEALFLSLDRGRKVSRNQMERDRVSGEVAPPVPGDGYKGITLLRGHNTTARKAKP
jgi:hypothetical protein